MNRIETLHAVLHETEWAVMANEVTGLMEMQIENAANKLVHAILERTCTVEELRAGVVWANALDAESVRTGLSSIASNEALARRICHHAGRRALEQVSTRSKLSTLRSQAWFARNKTTMF